MLLDASILWGTDIWARDHRPDWAHHVDEAVWNRQRVIWGGMDMQPDGGLLMPFPSATDRDFETANRQVVAAAERLGPSFRAIAAVRPGGTKSVDDLEALIETATIKPAGIKLWPYLGHFDLDALAADDRLRRLLVANGMFALMHVGNGRERATRPAFPAVRATPDVALACAVAMPETPIVVAHVARLDETVLAAAASRSNLYIDLSGLTSLGRWLEDGRDGLPVDGAQSFASLGPTRILEELVHRFGLADRLLFGTTWPFCTWWGIDLPDDVALVQRAELSDADRRAIFSGNLRRPLD